MIRDEEDPPVIKAILGDTKQVDVERLAEAYRGLKSVADAAAALRADLAVATQLAGVIRGDEVLYDIGADLAVFSDEMEARISGFLTRFRKRAWG